MRGVYTWLQGERAESGVYKVWVIAVLEVRGDKIHVHADNASHNEDCVASDLVRAGVDEADLVLERIPPHVRAKLAEDTRSQ